MTKNLGVVCESSKGILDVKFVCLLETFSAITRENMGISRENLALVLKMEECFFSYLLNAGG